MGDPKSVRGATVEASVVEDGKRQKKLSFTSTREKQATTKNRVTDSLILKLRLKKLMLN